VGSPYDTLEEVIGLRGQNQGSLIEFGIRYRQLELTGEGTVDWGALGQASDSTRLVLIQRFLWLLLAS